MQNKCPFCNKNLEEKISFRSECPYCIRDLHCCLACKFYEKGKPNDCRIPDIELVKDKEKANFCEEFQLKEKEGQKKEKRSTKLGEVPKPKGFSSLFDD